MALCIIFFLIGIILIICAFMIDIDAATGGLLGTLFIAISILTLIYEKSPNSPDSIDVYRGKTKLQVEGYYQEDSTFVITDSTVVFKE